jgi:pimeloyl-ACP methyl ester carboxylesterase
MRRALVVLVLALLGFVFLWPESRPGPTGGWLRAASLVPRYETIDGLRVRYVRAGSGPGVVLLHGFASSIYTWKDVLPELAKRRDVLALDFPGFGESDQPEDLDAARYPGLVFGLCDRLGLGRVAIVGNSMGGGVATIMAGERPERVEALVLLDAAGFDLSPSQRPWIIRLAGLKYGGLLVDNLPVRGLLLRRGLNQVFHDPSLVTAERYDEYLAPLVRPGALASMRSLLLTRANERARVREAAGRVKARTLVVWGRNDRWVPVEQADRYLAAIPGACKVVLEDCGHLPQEERPQELLGLLREFLSDAG